MRLPETNLRKQPVPPVYKPVIPPPVYRPVPTTVQKSTAPVLGTAHKPAWPPVYNLVAPPIHDIGSLVAQNRPLPGPKPIAPPVYKSIVPPPAHWPAQATAQRSPTPVLGAVHRSPAPPVYKPAVPSRLRGDAPTITQRSTMPVLGTAPKPPTPLMCNPMTPPPVYRPAPLVAQRRTLHGSLTSPKPAAPPVYKPMAPQPAYRPAPPAPRHTLPVSGSDRKQFIPGAYKAAAFRRPHMPSSQAGQWSLAQPKLFRYSRVAPGVIQPLIITFNTNSNDYATMKVLYSLRKAKPGEAIVTYSNAENANNAAVENAVLAKDENVYVVGHGSPGDIWTGGRDSDSVDLGRLAAALVGPLSGVEDWEGEVRLLSCRSGVAPDEGASLATLLSEQLSEYNLIRRIKGTEGYSYGTVTAGGSGFTNVLKPHEFSDNLYKGGYVKHMETAFTAPEDGWTNVPNASRRKSLNLVIHSAKTAAKAWVQVRNQIESELKEEVATASNDGANSIETTLTALKKNRKWNTLLAEQEREFTHYKLFSDDGFKSA